MAKLIYITVLGTFISFLVSCEKTETVEATESASTTDAAPAKEDAAPAGAK